MPIRMAETVDEPVGVVHAIWMKRIGPVGRSVAEALVTGMEADRGSLVSPAEIVDETAWFR